jgi:molecular chaperone DnaK
MSAPPHSGSSNRRKHARTRVSLLVQYRFNSLEDFLAEYSVNLSPGGIFISTDRPAPVGTMLYVQFSLKDGSKLIEGMGRVARVEPKGMGIEFTQFDEESLDLVHRICEGRLTRR